MVIDDAIEQVVSIRSLRESSAVAAIRALEFLGVDTVFGIPGVSVTSPTMLITEVQVALERNQPTILDVPSPGRV